MNEAGKVRLRDSSDPSAFENWPEDPPPQELPGLDVIIALYILGGLVGFFAIPMMSPFYNGLMRRFDIPLPMILYALSFGLAIGLWRRQEWARKLSQWREGMVLLYYLAAGSYALWQTGGVGNRVKLLPIAIAVWILSYLSGQGVRDAFVLSRQFPEKVARRVAIGITLAVMVMLVTCQVRVYQPSNEISFGTLNHGIVTKHLTDDEAEAYRRDPSAFIDHLTKTEWKKYMGRE